MRHISCHYKKLNVRRLKIAVIAVIISLFFMPSFIKYVKTGNNMFKVTLNGTYVGTVSTEEEAEELYLTARKNISSQSEELTFLNAKLETAGEEVDWGKVDDSSVIISNMETVLSNDIITDFARAYEMKIGGYIVDLKTQDEVVNVLQAAINKYDPSEAFTVSLQTAADRELPVANANVVSKKEMVELEQEETVEFSSGFDKEMDILFDSIEPEKELSFEEIETGITSMKFGSEIEVVEIYATPSILDPMESAIEEVTKEEEQNVEYTVVSGDTLSAIALKVDVPMDEIIAMNDSLEDQNSLIRPDDILVVSVPKPKLSVIRQEVMIYEETYDAPIQYIYRDDWYTSDMVVHQKASAGYHKVAAEITFENDKSVDTQITKEEVLYEPVVKIVEKGTKIPPSYIKPIYGGRLSSKFGYRNRPTKGASSYHKGVDWATPVGTAVFASCGGTVVKAGWGSGYGNVIYINHPDGRQTRYGHLSKVLVSSGQQVSQGQKIALSGNTGVSTGPHLHFEILIGGSQVNPLSYVSQ